MHSIPLRRLVLLIVAAGLLFTALGLLSAITSAPLQKYVFSAFIAAIFTGLVAGFYTLVSARKPAAILAVLVSQLVLTPLVRTLAVRMQQYQTPVSFETAARLYAPVAIVMIALSYSLFLRFIQTEGRYAFRAQTELALAHGIQHTLVPVVDLKTAGFEVYGLSLPSEKVGGDLVDAVCLPSGGGFAYLTDIAGHGLNAGILMGMVKTAVRTCLTDDSTPGTVFDTLNRILPGVKEAHMYATCAAFRLKRGPDGRCEVLFALAGHPPVLHLSVSGEVKPRLSEEQFPLGLLPFQGYESRCIETSEGDILIAATDGILEACSKDGVEFGVEGLETFVATRTKLPLAKLASEIFAAAKEIGPQEDDRTLLILRVL